MSAVCLQKKTPQVSQCFPWWFPGFFATHRLILPKIHWELRPERWSWGLCHCESSESLLQTQQRLLFPRGRDNRCPWDKETKSRGLAMEEGPFWASSTSGEEKEGTNWTNWTNKPISSYLKEFDEPKSKKKQANSLFFPFGKLLELLVWVWETERGSI